MGSDLLDAQDLQHWENVRWRCLALVDQLAEAIIEWAGHGQELLLGVEERREWSGRDRSDEQMQSEISQPSYTSKVDNASRHVKIT